MNNIVFIKRTSALFLAIVLATGTITLIYPTFMTNVQATKDRDNDYDNDEEKKSHIKDRDDESRDNDKDYDDDKDKSYEKESRDYDEKDYDNDDNKKSYDKTSYNSKYSSYKDNYKSEYSSYSKDKSKDSNSNSVSINKIKCNNINVNVNGLELNILSPFLADSGLAAEAVEDDTDPSSIAGNGDNSGSEINDFRFVCINNNNNTVIEGEEPKASLTVKKQIFGCADIPEPTSMACILENNSTQWLDCNNSSISGTIFCLSLPPSIFDIEVLDDQDTQIQEFEGSIEGTSVQNLEPGTYTVNEIIHPFPGIDRLSVNGGIAQNCINLGFDNGGELLNTTSNTVYIICLQYEDEQGNDCSTITLTAAEARTCTVKNYILVSNDSPPNSP